MADENEIPARLEHIIENLADRLGDSAPAKSSIANWVPAFLVLVGWLASLAFIWGTTTQRIDGIANTLSEIKTAVSDFPIVKDHQKQTEDHVQHLQEDMTKLTAKVDSIAGVIDGIGLRQPSPHRQP